ncbi:OmpR/PhoB-type domain-containing protein [Vibrio owensii]|uniref:winged helix-turn-helix domain-containing protein n=1 Tax=Vibrio owensii TaxID=696485 RepID=UPI002893E1A4|nr:OmpR/PhoB-type domain-containing protein [Vibrio owensii]CAH1550840.1 OmpR/PhoB-type domain-containing protein [Vibrio owensii]
MLLSINEASHTIDAHDDSTQTLIKSVSMGTSSLNIAKKLFEDTSKVYAREALIASGWPDKPIGSNSLNVSIMKLRRKLESIDANIEIKSYPTLGYKLILPKSIDVLSSPSIGMNSASSSHDVIQGRKSITQASKTSKQASSSTIRWGDLLLSALILLYSSALYHSLYSL